MAIKPSIPAYIAKSHNVYCSLLTVFFFPKIRFHLLINLYSLGEGHFDKAQKLDKHWKSKSSFNVVLCKILVVSVRLRVFDAVLVKWTPDPWEKGEFIIKEAENYFLFDYLLFSSSLAYLLHRLLPSLCCNYYCRQVIFYSVWSEISNPIPTS